MDFEWMTPEEAAKKWELKPAKYNIYVHKGKYTARRAWAAHGLSQKVHKSPWMAEQMRPKR